MKHLLTTSDLSFNQKIIITLVLSISVIFVHLYSLFTNTAVIPAMQLYLLPIIFAVFYFPKKGLLISGILLLIALLFTVLLNRQNPDWGITLLMVFVMGIIALILSVKEKELMTNRFKFKTLFDYNTRPLVAFDNDGIITDVNYMFEKKSGCKKELIIGKNIGKVGIYSDESKEKIQDIINSKSTEKFNKPFLVELKNPEKKEEKIHYLLTFLTSSGCIDNSSSDAKISNITIAAFADATKYVKAYEGIKEREKKYYDLSNFLPLTVIETDSDYKITFINKKGLQSFGLTKEDMKNEIYAKDFICTDNFKECQKIFEKLMKGEIDEHSFEDCFAQKKDGSKFPIILYTNPIKDKDVPVGIRFAVVDLTKIKEAEKALDATEKKLSRLMQNFSGMAYRCRIDEHLSAEYLSDGFYELSGYSQSDIIKGKPINLKSIIHPDDFEIFKENVLKSLGKDNIFEARYRILTAKGEEKWVWNQGWGIKDDNGLIIAVEGVISNITELVKTENELKEFEKQKQLETFEALKEKEILLKEIHHRVKNNLQIIASILKLKDLQSDDEGIHDILLDCRSRVFSMAMIHEKLYRSENLARINLKDYITTLYMHLSDEYGADDEKIIIVCDCDEDITLDIDTAIPCGLIINEILTNSLKYAFDESGGEIKIDFHRKEDDRYVLRVKDSGKGFSEYYDYENSESLGMQLIYNLTAQLEGEIEVRNNPGAEYIITIPAGIQKSVKF